LPTYEFLCQSCSLLYEKFTRNRNPNFTCPCPQCDFENKTILSAPNHQFSEKGAVPTVRGETGSYQVDYSTDLNVGRDADLRWESVKDRESLKQKVKNPILAPYKDTEPNAKVAMKRDAEGNYAPMSRTEVLANAELRKEARIYDEKKKLS
jgi:putative FmdB family regulatory protein